MALHQAFEENNFKGYVEAVPAYASLAIFYDVAVVAENHSIKTTVFDIVKSLAEKIISEINLSEEVKRKIIVIPVYYNGEDLDVVAKHHQLSPQQVIDIHTSKTYRVFMIGFLPGFAYMGKVDERIATPRLSSPRTNVKAGSVGIAGFQTGIYSIESPGGWQLVGQTPIKIFDKEKPNPCLFNAGDEIQFISISKEEFEKRNEY